MKLLKTTCKFDRLKKDSQQIKKKEKMKKLLIIILLVLAANVVEAQTNTSPKINIVVDRTLEDYTVPNEIVNKLNDSRLYNRIGSYGNFDELNGKVGDYVIYIYSFNLNGIIGNTTRIDYFEIIYINGVFEYARRFSPFTYTVSGISDHKTRAANTCYNNILEIFPK